ncbi:hypothetical protein SAMN05421666_3522 [Roseovarius nanhaiticus]|uniref:Uncharacterized protein n=1 Tax=Roseovarius nanhaiticus TaxID=573024 RepID=A0A1N7HNH2_9RHOB|nr:hypothetical protein [Roseovarius nanhaiticus]SEL39680.1 hypothetical protein SAMN05216208_0023 [Roseovarius nanhaiticus]SIS26353.1 hypothetical protein SAMN05421666_3522 [Roseovarius nanhaiticus]
MTFETPAIGAKFSQLGDLLKNPLTSIGRDTDALSSINRMSACAAFLGALFYWVRSIDSTQSL